ncbi:hypothetical protein ABCR94_15590 [Streptomyces sp. 21So2-11]|uniref:hypothetical protein n=1 Tax=Streptomyces sp. 21So2-11 TaxID=3144408 RepID=UPI00321AB1DC
MTAQPHQRPDEAAGLPHPIKPDYTSVFLQPDLASTRPHADDAIEDEPQIPSISKTRY